MEIKAFKSGDLKNFRPQKKQTQGLPVNWREILNNLAQAGPAASFQVKCETIAVAGLWPDDLGFQAWALISENPENHLLGLVKSFQWFLDYFHNITTGPITLFGLKHWPNARQLAIILGFKLVGPSELPDYNLWVYEPGKE